MDPLLASIIALLPTRAPQLQQLSLFLIAWTIPSPRGDSGELWPLTARALFKVLSQVKSLKLSITYCGAPTRP